MMYYRLVQRYTVVTRHEGLSLSSMPLKFILTCTIRSNKSGNVEVVTTLLLPDNTSYPNPLIYINNRQGVGSMLYSPRSSTSGKSVKRRGLDNPFLIGNGNCTTALPVCAAMSLFPYQAPSPPAQL